MAYGLDFEEIYYTDTSRTDLGVLQTYEISIDLALEKDFSVETPDPILPVHGFWYILNTEYGGIVDKFTTSSDDNKITYEGRTFRGILDSHYVYVKNAERIIPEIEATLDDGGVTATVNATVTDCISQLIAESNLDGLFTVDDADISSESSVSAVVSPVLNGYTIKQGTTLYEAIIGLAKSIDFTIMLTYKADGKIHITPILIQDYVDYLKGSRYEGISFEVGLDTAIVNHVIYGAVQDDGNIRVAHFFADKNGGMQPYKTVEDPIKDSQYIVDKTSQLLFGIDEVTEYVETTDSVVENYEPLDAIPDDWETNFGSYYKHEFSEEYTAIADPSGNPSTQGWYVMENDSYVLTEDTEVVSGTTYYLREVSENWNEYEAVGDDIWTAVTSQPSDWAENYSSYYTRSWDSDTGEYVYSNISGTTVLDWNSIVAVTSMPSDWSTNYGEYYYAFQTGTGIEYESYDSGSGDSYVRMTAQPSDWNENFSSYYRKVYQKKTKKKTQLIDTVDRRDAYYVACAADDDRKNGTIPSFSARPHYRKDTYSIPPAFCRNNCYRIRTTETAPTYTSVNCYSHAIDYHAPVFNVGEGYRMVYDHYKGLADSATEFFYDERIKNSIEMELEYLAVNIGDIVGGTDELTGTNIVGSVSNIEATIENGLIDAFYKVQIDDYTSSLVEA